MCDLSPRQWNLLAALCDGGKLREPVPETDVIRAVYGPKARNKAHALAALCLRVQNRLNRAGAKLFLDRVGDKLSLKPTENARTQSCA